MRGLGIPLVTSASAGLAGMPLRVIVRNRCDICIVTVRAPCRSGVKKHSYSHHARRHDRWSNTHLHTIDNQRLLNARQ
jgi:hypothetical protein